MELMQKNVMLLSSPHCHNALWKSYSRYVMFASVFTTHCSLCYFVSFIGFKWTLLRLQRTFPLLFMHKRERLLPKPQLKFFFHHWDLCFFFLIYFPWVKVLENIDHCFPKKTKVKNVNVTYCFVSSLLQRNKDTRRCCDAWHGQTLRLIS